MPFIKKQSLHQRKIGDKSFILTSDGNIEINLDEGKEFRVDANVKVTGDQSGPKVANVFYVSTDGNDSNDGRSQDKNGAFASVKKAAEVAPEGSTIIVAPGDYFEANPITLRDFVTVTGQGELRNTRIFPKNQTSTIFYMGNGCYLYQLTFRALRAPGWCVEIRPGALVTTSPYVQNCTNMNGPWLNDGTEFIPFETVQIEGIEPGARPLTIEQYPTLSFDKQVNIEGGGGGMLVDGDAYDQASLVFSFVADAFTQISQGGIGFHVTNFGYTQIVSCFSVFCSTGFLTTKGGYLSISNSVSDFGTNGVIADGFYPIAYSNALPSQNYFSTVGSVTIRQPGIGYTSAPTVVISPPTGDNPVTATGEAQVDLVTGQLAAVSITNGGSGYEEVPTVTFVGGGATVQAEGEINLSTNSSLNIESLRDIPQTGSIIQFTGDPTYYYITANDITTQPFNYNEEVCKRDTRRIVDAVLGDIVMGTNYQAVAAATSYLRSTATKVILEQLDATVYAINVARDQMKNRTTNLAMKEEIDDRFSIITNVLQAGDSTGTPDLIYNDLSSIDDTVINAKDNIIANRDFIIEELTAYINDQFTELSYNQSAYETDMTNFSKGLAYYVALGSDYHTIRESQEFKTRDRFKTLIVDSFYNMRDIYLTVGGVGANSDAVTRVNEAFSTLINIVDDGDSTGITISFPSHDGAEAQREDARDQLQANKDFMVAEFIAYLNENSTGFTYVQADYEKSVERYIDALTFDILYKGDSACVTESAYIYDNLYLSALTTTQRQFVEDAFARLRFVVSRVSRGLGITKTTGNAETQDFSSGDATQSEATELDALVQIIESVISNNSIANLPTKTYPLFEDEVPSLQTAANDILSAYPTTIAVVQGDILTDYPDLTYNVDKCKRDVGYIIDAVYRDSQLGTNHHSITAGNAYLRANTAYLNVQQKPATILALREAKRLSIAAANTNALYAEVVEDLWNTVLNIIEFDQLPSEGQTYPEPGPASTELVNAKEQLLLNKDFLTAETLAYINNSYFVYDNAKCERDTGLIIDAARYDAALGTNYNAVTAGLAYQRANSGYVISDQITQTVGAITYAKGQSTTATIGDSTAQSRVGAAFDEVIDIIQNGVTSTDTAADPLTFTNPTGATTGQINAKEQLIANRDFLAAEAVSYVQNNYQNFTYNRTKCERDTGLIMDAVALDIALGTNYNSVTAGLGYQRASSSELQDNQLIQTSASLTELKKQLVLLGLSDSAQPRAEAAMDEIIDILENGVLSTDTAADALVFPTPSSLPTTNAVEAKDALIANKTFIIAEITAWIAVNFPSLSYDSTKCERDVGYIIDALCHDILYGGNFATRTVSNSYFVDGVSQLGDPSEEAATADAYARLRDVVGDVVIGASVIKSTGNTETQNTANIASSTEADDVEGLVEVIENVIRAGDLSGLPGENLPSISWVDGDLQQGYNTIKSNKETVVDEISIFIANTFQSFTYDETKCRRDVALIIEAAAYDAALGTNYNAITTGLAYQRANSAYVLSDQNLQTELAIEYVKARLNELELENSFINNVNAAITEVLDIFKNGTVSTDVAADALTITDPNVDVNHIRAFNEIQANKDFCAAEVIAWIGINYPSLVYDSTKCSRDVKYILDALSYDILYDSNLASKAAAESYFVGVIGQLGSGQEAATAAAYNELSLILSDVVQNITHGTLSQVVVTQDTTGPGADSGTAGEVQDLLQIIEDVIVAGNTDSMPADNTPDTSWLTAQVVTDFTTTIDATTTIQNQTINYLNETFTREFTFNSTKCNRDTKYIVDALTYDILYGGDSATVQAAQSYWVGATSQVNGQQPETAAALKWVKTLLGDVLLDVVAADPEQAVETQDTTAGAGTATEVTRAESLLTTFINVIENGIDNLPTSTTYPDTTWATSGIQAALGTLLSQKETIISDTISYINTTYNAFSYDQVKCERDTGYVIDAVLHDLLYTGNIATLIATRAYFLGTAQYLPDEQVDVTVAAYDHLRDVAVKCIEGISHAPTPGNTQSQVLSGNYGTSTESGIAVTLFNVISDAIENQSLVGTPAEVEADFSWLPASTRSSAATLLSNKTTIQNSTITYISDNILGFDYNVAKCERDTGYIIDALLYDTMYGGNKQTRRAGLAYYSGAILTGLDSTYADQSGITAYSYYYLGEILEKISQNIAVTTSYNNVATQDFSIPDSDATTAAGIRLLTDRIALSVLENSTAEWQENDHNYELGSGVYNTERVSILGDLENIVTTTIDSLNAQFGGEALINIFPGIISVKADAKAFLYNVSTISTSGHAFEYVGAGVTYNALPFFGGTAIPEQEIQQTNQGKVFAGGTVDQIGNFRVGDFFAVNALTGSITLNANEIDLKGLTSVGPFIRNGIPVGVELKEVSDNTNLVSSIGTQDFNTAPTQRAVSQYVENRYLNKLTGGTVTGNLVLDGDFDVNGDVLSTDTSGTFNLLNTSATTIEAFGDATTINMGANVGTFTINPDLVVEGALTVNGNINFVGDVSLNIPDETLQAYSISTEGSLDYISINTRTDEEKITFGIRPELLVENTNETTSVSTGALVIDGGVGIAKSIFAGGDLTVDGSVILGDDRAQDTIDINGITDIDVPDNLNTVFRIHENISDYLIIDTVDGSERIETGVTPNVVILNADDATSSTTGAVQSVGGISTELNLYAGVDIIADRDIIAKRDLEVNGTNIITDETGTFNLLNTNATQIDAFGAATTINIGATTGIVTIRNEQVVVDSTASLQIPVGSNAQRPTPATGQIRFNNDSTTFEGYDGIAWGALGGVKDVDQNTFIRPETSPGANNDELEFFTNGSRRMIITNDNLTVESTNDVVITSEIESHDYQTGALKITGGVGIGNNLHVQGWIGGNNSGVLQLTRFATDTIDIRANEVLAQDGLRLISNAPDSAADDIIYPMTFAHHTISGTPVVGSGTGIKFELETSNANFETGAKIDVVAQDVTGSQEDFDMVISTMSSGSVTEKLRISETTSTLTTSLQIDQNLTVTGILDAAGITSSIYADDSTEMLDAINNRLIVSTGQIGELTLTTDLEVQYGGTGVSTFTTDGILYGNAADPVQVTAAAGAADASNSFQILTVTSDADATPVWTDTIDGGTF
jgi:hypothetical protein